MARFDTDPWKVGHQGGKTARAERAAQQGQPRRGRRGAEPKEETPQALRQPAPPSRSSLSFAAQLERDSRCRPCPLSAGHKHEIQKGSGPKIHQLRSRLLEMTKRLSF